MAGVWVVIAALIARSVPIRTGAGKVLLFVVLVAVPFWELPYGALNLSKLCDEHSRLAIFEKFPPQERICVQELDYSLTHALRDANFLQVEVRRGLTSPTGNDGFVRLAKSGELKSDLCLEFVSNTQLSWRVVRHDESLIRAKDNHVVARQSHFDWAGMWWQELASPLLGHGGRCSPNLRTLLRTVRSGTT
jgi:hypothetical protein